MWAKLSLERLMGKSSKELQYPKVEPANSNL
jgi:hypothetical protein